MLPIMNIALRAARQANEYIVQAVDKRESNSADASADIKLLNHLEATLFQVLFDSLKPGYPTHYLAEPGETLASEKDDSWHIIGFDSASHLFKKLPTCTYSIVHRHQGKTQNTMVISPFTGNEFTATRGRGATLNSRRIRCTSAKSLAEASLGSNSINQFKNASQDHAIADFISELSNNVGQIYVSGNNTLDIAMVASGQLDAAVLTNSSIDTLEASLLLCQESGVLSGTLNGGLLKSGQGNIVAANPKLYKSLVQRFGGYEAKLQA